MCESTVSLWTMVAALCTAATTVAYTIATVFICRANRRSADAASEQSRAMQIQTEELIRQYRDSTRARIAIRFGYDNGTGKYLILKNVGKHDADQVRVEVGNGFLDALDQVFPDSHLCKLTRSTIHIASGQEFPILVGFASHLGRIRDKKAQVAISYKDGEDFFCEKAEIDFSQYDFLATCWNVRMENGVQVREEVKAKG